MASKLTNTLSMTQAMLRVQARLDHGNPYDQVCTVLSGPTGIGKTSILKPALEQYADVITCIPGFGSMQQEELLGYPIAHIKDGLPVIEIATHDSLLPTQHQIDTWAAKHITKENGEQVCKVILFIDEIFSFNSSGQENQLRSLLTLRRVGPLSIPLQTMMFGTTNPQTSDYTTRRTVDASIKDRCEELHVHACPEMTMRLLTKLVIEGKYPEECKSFLMLPSNTNFLEYGSPRFWHEKFGGLWAELKAADLKPDDLRALFTHSMINALEQSMRLSKMKKGKSPDSIIAAFIEFVMHGESDFPVSGRAIVFDTDADYKANRAKLDKWVKAKKNLLVNLAAVDTVQVIIALGIDHEKCKDDAVWKRVVDFVDMVESDILDQMINQLQEADSMFIEHLMENMTDRQADMITRTCEAYSNAGASMLN